MPTQKTPTLPAGVSVQIRAQNNADRVAFGFIYLPDDTRVGFTTVKDSGAIELWVGNWGEPTKANLRKANVAADMLAATLPWHPTVEWKVER